MHFWSFMAMENALVPAVLIGFGKYFMRHAPRDINPIFGYRTVRSMQSMDQSIDKVKISFKTIACFVLNESPILPQLC